MPTAQNEGFLPKPGLRKQQQLQIAKKYVMLNSGGPTKCGSPTTRTCRDNIFIKGQPSVVDLREFGNIFQVVGGEEEMYVLDCSKLPEGYYCFVTTETDPYSHAIIMHDGIPIFYFYKPTNSTDRNYRPCGYEEFFERDGFIPLRPMRNELHQRMHSPKTRPPPPRSSSSSSFPPRMTYQQARRLHFELRQLLTQVGRPYPKQLLRRFTSSDISNAHFYFFEIKGSKDNDSYHMRPGVFSCPRQCRFIDGGVAHPENDSSF